MLLQDYEKPALFNYAFVGSYPAGTIHIPDTPLTVTCNFENTLNTLRDLAIPEEWEYKKTPFSRPLPILYNYLVHTFARIKEEEKIAENGNYSYFNTGLVTPKQEEIFMFFRKDQFRKGWYFHEFCKDGSNNMDKFSPLPERASYFSDNSELIYDTRLDLLINIEHIVNDTENFARFPKHIKGLSTYQLVNTFREAIEHTKKRVKRNYLTAIPQYYIAKSQLQLLLPLCLTDPSRADLALAVYKKDGIYSARTCLTLDMAINNARLIAKPNSEWLIA